MTLTSTSKQPLSVAFLDDSLTFRLLWQRRRDLGIITAYETPEAFLDAFEKQEGKSLDRIITDFHFTPKSQMTGTGLAKRVRASKPEQTIILCSNLPELSDDLAGIFDALIAKESASTISLDELLSLVREGGERSAQL